MVARKVLTGRRAADVSAGICGALLAYDVALLLGVPWNPYPQMLHLSEPATRVLFSGIGALLWATFALAFLARGGRGPLRGAPPGLVAVICWFAVLSTASSILAGLGMVVTPGSLAVRLVQLAFVAFAVVALLRTRQDGARAGPAETDPPALRARGRGGGDPSGVT